MRGEKERQGLAWTGTAAKSSAVFLWIFAELGSKVADSSEGLSRDIGWGLVRFEMMHRLGGKLGSWNLSSIAFGFCGTGSGIGGQGSRDFRTCAPLFLVTVISLSRDHSMMPPVVHYHIFHLER